MPEDLGAEIMEISGLDQVQLPEGAPATIQMPDYPGYSDPYPQLSAFIGTSVWSTVLAIGIPILAAVVVKVVMAGRELKGGVSGLSALGIIKKCRISDRTSKRPAREQKWCLWDSKGKRILGRHPNRDKALSQEKLIHLKFQHPSRPRER